ncbi:MAG: NAD(P)/FAD-dependent oxidoreductase [Phaeodactylibacter sp.]|uniref:flavin-containing monooxygenase n=1 Tax=Phaeodactylibacter sp. TaxID=1940289 RepID=UPI0032EFAABF
MKTTPILIVGAGPAGLAMAGRLRHRGLEFEIIEQSHEVGHAWHHHYERVHLHTVKEYSHLPYLPFPEDYPQYVSRQQLVDYLEGYAEHFRIQPHFGHSLERVAREGADWVATCSNGLSFKARQVIFATGVNRIPNIPLFADQEDFSGTVLHSRDYRNAAPYQGETVLVVGMGNTGAEIALDLSEASIPTLLSVRGAVNVVPRDFLGRATQKTAFALARLPRPIGDWIGQQVQGLAFGNLRPYGLKPSPVPPARQLRETGKTPVIDVGTVAAIKAGKIKVVPALKAFTPDGAIFEDGSEHHFSTVILATGYYARLEAFLPHSDKLFNADHLPKSCIGEGPHEGLYFLGFDNYQPGGILGVVYRDSERIAEALADYFGRG